MNLIEEFIRISKRDRRVASESRVQPQGSPAFFIYISPAIKNLICDFSGLYRQLILASLSSFPTRARAERARVSKRAPASPIIPPLFAISERTVCRGPFRRELPFITASLPSPFLFLLLSLAVRFQYYTSAPMTLMIFTE